MNLETVTITGADDRTDVAQMTELSIRYPFVEWGILVSERREGSYRFPSREWIGKMLNFQQAAYLRLSTHVCGRWVREAFAGTLQWRDLPDVWAFSDRIQLNTHSSPHVIGNLMRRLVSEPKLSDKCVIFQFDGVNDSAQVEFIHAYRDMYKRRASGLFDTSGGAGVEPEGWPTPFTGINCGFAGGLGPENVEEHVRRIESLCQQPYWIDMERRVRTDDDSQLNMNKVEAVLATVNRMMKSA